MTNRMITEEMKEEWKPILEDAELPSIKDSYRKRVTMRLLENTKKLGRSEFGGTFLQEAPITNNVTTGVDNTDAVLINMARRTAPNLLAYDLAGVQAMSGPSQIIFCLRAHYGTQPQGPHGRPGDGRPGFETGDDLNTDGNTQAQQWGVDGKAPNEAFYNEPNTAYSGTGTQTSHATAPNYSTYAVGDNMTTSQGETLGRGETGDLDWQQMSITIDKTHVVAGESALRADYTWELAQDLKAVHGLDAETEISNLLSTELLAEINRRVTNTIRKVAKIAAAEVQYENGSVELDSNNAAVYSATGTFDLNKNTDGRWQKEKFSALLFKIEKECNAIAKDTRRGKGNVLIVSSDVASMLHIAGKLEYAPGMDNNLNVDDTGNLFAGLLHGRIKVYVDNFLGYNEVIVGYKGANQYDAGFFYCPYVPLQMQKVVHPDTMQPALGFKTRYGLVANPFTTMQRNKNSYYRKFVVTGL